MSIGYEAFAGCSSLESVSLPASVEFVDDMAFFQCTKLNHLEFGSLRVLGDKCVWWCVELKSIHFRGTVAEWESVYKYETWYGNTVLDSVICSDGTVTLK